MNPQNNNSQFKQTLRRTLSPKQNTIN